MRVPLYYHVYIDLVKFMPSIIDFGVVPLNFDIVRLPVSFKVRPLIIHGREIYLTDAMLPLND